MKIKINEKINFDTSKPDGINRKLLDIKKLNDIGFRPKINLKEGLIKTYEDFISTHN